MEGGGLNHHNDMILKFISVYFFRLPNRIIAIVGRTTDWN